MRGRIWRGRGGIRTLSVGEAPALTTRAAPAGGGSVPSPLQASMDTHPQAGGFPPLKPPPPLPLLNPAQAALAEALDPAAESGFLHSQSLLDFSSLLL